MNVACYVRVSTEEQKKYGISLDAQRSRLTAFCKENKYKSTFYADEGISARKAANKRPALMQLLDDVSAGKIDLILFTKLDRWTRNVREYHKCQEVLEAKNVPWKAVDEDYETQTASGRFKVNIMLAVAEDEADRTSERIKAVFADKKSRNEAVVPQAPRGYYYKDKHIYVLDGMQETIAAAFQTFLDSGSLKKVCRDFPSLNLNLQSCNRFLRNRAYIGEWCGIKIEPLISEEMFYAVQKSLHKAPRQTKPDRTYIFSGLLICGECRHRINGRVYKRKHSEAYFYLCPHHNRMKECSQLHQIREKVIEKYLLDNLEDTVSATVKSRKKQKKVIDYETPIKKKLTKLADLYLNDLISEQDYKSQYETLNAQLQSIPKQETPQKQYNDFFFAGWKDVYAEMDRETKKAFWRNVIDEIVILDGKVQGFKVL